MGGWDWMMRGWAAYGLDQCDHTIGITDGQVIEWSCMYVLMVIMQRFGYFCQMYLNAYKYSRPAQLLIEFLARAFARTAIYLMFGPL